MWNGYKKNTMIRKTPRTCSVVFETVLGSPLDSWHINSNHNWNKIGGLLCLVLMHSAQCKTIARARVGELWCPNASWSIHQTPTSSSGQFRVSRTVRWTLLYLCKLIRWSAAIRSNSHAVDQIGLLRNEIQCFVEFLRYLRHVWCSTTECRVECACKTWGAAACSELHKTTQQLLLSPSEW